MGGQPVGLGCGIQQGAAMKIKRFADFMATHSSPEGCIG
jgi:hypothetical protein